MPSNVLDHSFMNTHALSGNALNTALAALVGVAAAAVVKLLLDESPEVTQIRPTAPRPDQADRTTARRAKLREMAEATHDPMYLADVREVNEDFAFADAENI